MANSIKEVLSKAGNRSSVPQQYIPKTARTEPVFDEPTLHQDGWADEQGNRHHVSAPTLEDDIRALAEQQPRRQIAGADMERIEQLLGNGITAAYEDTCAAIDKMIREAQELTRKIEIDGEARKASLREEGQKHARNSAAAMQELTRTVKWLEEQAPKLRNPKLDSAKPEAPALDSLEDHPHDPPPT